MGCGDNNNKEEETLDDIQLQAVKSIYPQIYKAMQKIPQCLEKTTKQEELLLCSKEVGKLNKELAMSMGYIVDDKNLKTLQEIDKAQMIKNTNKSLQEIQKTVQCIKNVESMEEVDGCMSLQIK